MEVPQERRDREGENRATSICNRATKWEPKEGARPWLGAHIMRSTDVRKKLGTASFAGKPFIIRRPAMTGNDEITTSKKRNYKLISG